MINMTNKKDGEGNVIQKTWGGEGGGYVMKTRGDGV